MKQSQYLEILKLAKRSLEDYVNWGQDEVLRMPTEIAGQARNDGSVIVSQARNDGSAIAGQAPNEGAIVRQNAAPFQNRELAPQQPARHCGLDPQSIPQLEALKDQLKNCRQCPLGEHRLNCVFGVGNPNADLMFIGEGPGYEEDHQGIPFIGKAGQLLTKVIEAMGLTRDSVYIANVVKCHPMKDPLDPQKRANDRPPTTLEIQTCQKYLDMQIDIIKPKVIAALGASALKALLPDEKESISRLRGNFKEYRNIPLMPTYHPSFLLRNGYSFDNKTSDSPALKQLKKDYWQDMKKIMNFLDSGTLL
ncbi:MAG: uracil-DNA glycosylase [Elusimicrobiota bacterium]|jgi:DNA polymerase|nr:uracil-DNA glycosylase [Elusimicrobiota bacterium]